MATQPIDRKNTKHSSVVLSRKTPVLVNRTNKCTVQDITSIFALDPSRFAGHYPDFTFNWGDMMETGLSQQQKKNNKARAMRKAKKN